jgi:hypothetical protein
MISSRQAFRTDCGYAVQIAEVAALLARQEHRDPGAVNPRDGDRCRTGDRHG